MAFIGKQPTPVPLTSSDITDGIISTAKIADDAVTGAKIENNPTIAGNLAVSGTTTLSSTLGVTGVTTLSDSIVFGASAKGVHLGVTSVTSTNLLDDYEQGSHTITFTNVSLTPSGAGASYTKIGNTVLYVGSFTFPSSSDTNPINISLPFSSSSLNSLGQTFTNGRTDKVLFTGGGGTNYMRIYPDNSFATNSYADFSGVAIYFSISYLA
tara:strand:+ start:23 stop:655 length:633 start_codon:yes stop_codon:yes gene_type:complete